MDEETTDKPDPPSREGATTDLPPDRITVKRFREAFPRARWSDRLNAWFVPGRPQRSASEDSTSRRRASKVMANQKR